MVERSTLMRCWALNVCHRSRKDGKALTSTHAFCREPGRRYRSARRVVVAVPGLVATSRRMLEAETLCEKHDVWEAGFQLSKGFFPPSTPKPQSASESLVSDSVRSYETNIPFALRFMVDRGLAGGGWVLAENYFRREGASLDSLEVAVMRRRLYEPLSDRDRYVLL